MGLYIKECGGSIVIVERYYVDGEQKEHYVKAIEPKSTKARLDQVRSTYFTKYWKSQKIGAVPVMMKGDRTTSAMMTKKKTVTYKIEDLKTLQENETDISRYKGMLKKTLPSDRRRILLISISTLRKENNMILKGSHTCGKDIATDREKGRVIVTDKSGKVY